MLLFVYWALSLGNADSTIVDMDALRPLSIAADLSDCVFEYYHRTSEDKAHASAFVNHLISVCSFSRELVWKANLRLIAGLISTWGVSLSINKMDLLHMLNRKDEGSRSSLSEGDRIVSTGVSLDVIVAAAAA